MPAHVVLRSLLLGVSGCLLLACGSEGPTAPRAPFSSQPALLDRFNDFRGRDAAEPGRGAGAGDDLDALLAPVGEPVEVDSGYIDGRMGPIEVDQATDHHLGAVESFDDFEYLIVSFAAHTDAGVAMFMMYIDDGWESPLFTEGRLTGGLPVLDEQTLRELSAEELEELFSGTTVMGCAGEELAQLDWDQTAVEYELRLAEGAGDEDLEAGRVTLEVDATFVDPYTERELAASGSVGLTRP